MTQSDTQKAGNRAVAQAKAAAGVPTLRQALVIIAATGVIAVLVGLLPHF